MDIAEAQTAEGKPYLFVAIGQTGKFAVAQPVDRADRKTAREFLEHLLAAVPRGIHTIPTDTGIQLAGQPRNRNTVCSRPTRFAVSGACAAPRGYGPLQLRDVNGTGHRLTKPNRPRSRRHLRGRDRPHAAAVFAAREVAPCAMGREPQSMTGIAASGDQNRLRHVKRDEGQAGGILGIVPQAGVAPLQCRNRSPRRKAELRSFRRRSPGCGPQPFRRGLVRGVVVGPGPAADDLSRFPAIATSLVLAGIQAFCFCVAGDSARWNRSATSMPPL